MVCATDDLGHEQQHIRKILRVREANAAERELDSANHQGRMLVDRVVVADDEARLQESDNRGCPWLDRIV